MEDIKGEFVVVVEGFKNDINEEQELNIIEQVNFYVNNGMATMEAIKTVSKERGMKKNDVYAEYHRGGK